MADIQHQIAFRAKVSHELAPTRPAVVLDRIVLGAVPEYCTQRVATAYSARRRSPTDPARAGEHRQAMAAAIAWYRSRHRRSEA